MARFWTSAKPARRLVPAKPLIVNLLVSSVFAQCQECSVHLLAQRTIGWEDNAVVLLVEYPANYLRQSLAVMRCIMEDCRCIKHDGVDLPLQKCVVEGVDARELSD